MDEDKFMVVEEMSSSDPDKACSWSPCEEGDPLPLLINLTEDEDNIEQIQNARIPVVDDVDDTSLVECQGTLDTELQTSFQEIEKTRLIVRERLDKMKIIEERELEKFSTLTRFSPGTVIFPAIRYAGTYHTITFLLENSNSVDPKSTPASGFKPFPQVFTSKWNPDYVPMPCCSQNQHVIIQVRNSTRSSFSNGPTFSPSKVRTEERIQNWDHIRQVLSQTIESCDDLNRRINQITFSKQTFNVLKHTIEEIMSCDVGFNFFQNVLPFMVKLCLDLPMIITCPIPLLKRYRTHSISLTQRQIGSLLANAFFCTFPPRLENEGSYPSINFNDLYICDPSDPRLLSMAHKLRCILHYFERLSKRQVDNGVVTFTRKSHISARCPNWDQSTKRLTQLVCLCSGNIETDGAGMLQVDFANKYVGGGVLGRGAVQEEILFVIYPELLISRLFTEKLFTGEALLVTGSERFSSYTGYSSSFAFSGDYQDLTPFDSKGRRLSQIVAIDALYIRKELTQFNPRFMERDLNKAYAGFSFPAPPTVSIKPAAVASGRWGCGAFNGNPELKAILQLLAASEAGRDLVLFVFGDDELQESVVTMYEALKDLTVGEVWKQLRQYYSLFCAENESSGKPPYYSLSQFVTECVTTQNLDFDNTPTETESCEAETQEPSSSSKASPPPNPDQRSPKSVEEDIELVPVSPKVTEKEFTVIDIDDVDDRVVHSSSSEKPSTPTKLYEPPPLSELYNESAQRVGTPSKIGVVDLDKSPRRVNNSAPLVSEVPDLSEIIEKRRLQRLLEFANASSDEEEEPGQSQKGSPAKKIITDADYLAVFASPTKRRHLIPKPSSAKRKISMSPSGIELIRPDPIETRPGIRQKLDRSGDCEVMSLNN